MTTDEIMGLAQKYAASNGKALLEKLYGTNQSYTQQCAAGALKDRQELRSAIEALVADAERYRWLAAKSHKDTAYDRYGNGAHWSIGFFAADSRHALDAAIDAARSKT